MERSVRNRSRLYQVYLQHIETLREDVAKVSLILGSTRRESTLKPMSRAEFDARLSSPTANRDVFRRWVQWIVDTHERQRNAA